MRSNELKLALCLIPSVPSLINKAGHKKTPSQVKMKTLATPLILVQLIIGPKTNWRKKLKVARINFHKIFFSQEIRTCQEVLEDMFSTTTR